LEKKMKYTFAFLAEAIDSLTDSELETLRERLEMEEVEETLDGRWVVSCGGQSVYGDTYREALMEGILLEQAMVEGHPYAYPLY
jgi:hypothetical protein